MQAEEDRRTSRIALKNASIRPPGSPLLGAVCSRTAPSATAAGYARLNVTTVSTPARSRSNARCWYLPSCTTISQLHHNKEARRELTKEASPGLPIMTHRTASVRGYMGSRVGSRLVEGTSSGIYCRIGGWGAGRVREGYSCPSLRADET